MKTCVALFSTAVEALTSIVVLFICKDPNVFSTRDPQPVSPSKFIACDMYWIVLILSSGLNSAKLTVSGQIVSIIFHQPVPQQVFPLPPGRNPQLYLWPAAREATEVQDYLGDEYIVYWCILYIAGLGGPIFLCHKCEDAINVHSLPESLSQGAAEDGDGTCVMIILMTVTVRSFWHHLLTM